MYAIIRLIIKLSLLLIKGGNLLLLKSIQKLNKAVAYLRPTKAIMHVKNQSTVSNSKGFNFRQATFYDNKKKHNRR